MTFRPQPARAHAVPLAALNKRHAHADPRRCRALFPCAIAGGWRRGGHREVSVRGGFAKVNLDRRPPNDQRDGGAPRPCREGA